MFAKIISGMPIYARNMHRMLKYSGHCSH